MGLTAPASQNDVHTWTVDAQNLFLTDYHDHSPGKGTRLTGASITPGSLSGIHLSSVLQAVNPSQVGIQIGAASLNVPVSTSAATSLAVTFNQVYLTVPLIFVYPAFDTTNTYLIIPKAASVATTGFTLEGQTTATVGTTTGGYTFDLNWMAIPNA